MAEGNPGRMVAEGQVYEPLEDIPLICMTSFRAPFSGGYERVLPRGERFRVLKAPVKGATAVVCKPIRYRELHARMVPRSDRWRFWVYAGYYFCVNLETIHRDCRLVQGDPTLGNNVFSVLFAPVSLEVVQAALEAEFPRGRVWIRTSRHDSATRSVHLVSDLADFDGYSDSRSPEGGLDYLFDGNLNGSNKEIVAKATTLFDKLLKAGVELQYEVYDRRGRALHEQPRQKR